MRGGVNRGDRHLTMICQEKRGKLVASILVHRYGSQCGVN